MRMTREFGLNGGKILRRSRSVRDFNAESENESGSSFNIISDKDQVPRQSGRYVEIILYHCAKDLEKEQVHEMQAEDVDSEDHSKAWIIGLVWSMVDKPFDAYQTLTFLEEKRIEVGRGEAGEEQSPNNAKMMCERDLKLPKALKVMRCVLDIDSILAILSTDIVIEFDRLSAQVGSGLQVVQKSGHEKLLEQMSPLYTKKSTWSVFAPMD
ncbi:hypothetical protein BDC45DRAFT_589783 [Circinella umbellata]|nr:hypothetical protein BDC45DRAFT_589783 [Circinella umbellata]